MEIPRISTLIVSLISVFSLPSSAQLVGCDAVGCPNNPDSICPVGNTTLSELGISELDTTISSEPLTWTVGLQDYTETFQHVERDYFLGTPPSLNLTNSSTIRSCALFFEGVSSSLRFPGNQDLSEYLTGTCNDALDASCVSDFMSQAQTEVRSILSTAGQNWTESAVCTTLSGRLQNNAPKSCQVRHSQSWGTIVVQALTGSEAAPIANQSDCHPTTGKDYNVSLVSSTRWAETLPLIDGSSELQAFIYGITPVMTIFYPYAAGNNSSVAASEVHLNCMKVVGSTKNMFGGGGGSVSNASFNGPGPLVGTASERSCGNLMAMVTAIFVMLLLL